MKEIIPQPDLKDRLQIVTPVKQEYKMVAKIPRIKGLTLYSYNIETGDIKVVPLVQQVAVDLHGKPSFINKANYDPKLLYVQALNIKNARRKFQKFITQ